MNFLPPLRGIEHHATDLRAPYTLDVLRPDLERIGPGGVFGGAVGDELEDGGVGGLEVDVFGVEVVDCGDGSVGEDGVVC